MLEEDGGRGTSSAVDVYQTAEDIVVKTMVAGVQTLRTWR
jgi:hypothetical protein